MSFKDVLSVPGLKPVLFTLFMAAFGFGVILPILPFYALAHGAQPWELGALTATFAAMGLLFSPFLGKLGDRIGRKKVLLMGTAGFALSYVLFALANSLEMVFIARAIEGFFAAAIFPTCISLLSDLTTPHQRGRAMGLVGMSFSLGFIVGPAFGGLASAISVPDAFFLATGLSLLNFAAIFFMLREPHEKPESKDIMGQEISLLMHLRSPLLFIFLSGFITTFMIGGLDAVLALYTSERLHFTSAEVGILFTYIGALIMVMQFVSGNLVNKYGEVKLITAGLVLSGIGFLLLTFATSWLTLLLPLAIFVCGNVLVFPSAASLLTKKVQGKRGAVLGLDNSFRFLGQVIGPLLGGFLYGLNHGYPFIGLAISIWLYAIVFSVFGAKQLK
jgi:multidrug resistance protein